MLVSCIMPTYDRRGLVELALRCYQRQDWPEKELIVLDDGSDPIEDLCKGIPGVTYARHHGDKLLLGTKRNLCCEMARGEVICHFDDDDWSAPTRITDQVTRLLESGKAMTGYWSMYFWSELLGKAFFYDEGGPNYAVGTSMCYRRDWWKDHRFRDVAKAEDNFAVFAARDAYQLICAPADQLMVAVSHRRCTSNPNRLGQNCWPEVPKEKLNPQFFADLEWLAQGSHAAPVTA